MKIARFDAGFGPRIGVVAENGVIDLELAGISFSSMIELIEAGSAAIADISAAIAGRAPDHLLTDIRLLAPIPRPGKFLGIGMNYQDHADEAKSLGIETTQHQLWFNKQTSCVNGPYDAIEKGVTEKLDYEVELGIVIGKRCKSASAETARDYIFGYLVVNDVSARDWQFHTNTFTMGKSFDTHGPIGPWIVTADEVADPQALALRCLVNGDLRQSSNTSLMIHSIDRQIAYLSTAFTLEPGDILATGTPEGVGIGMTPQTFLQSGDIVRCEVDGIGVIENRVA